MRKKRGASRKFPEPRGHPLPLRRRAASRQRGRGPRRPGAVHPRTEKARLAQKGHLFGASRGWCQECHPSKLRLCRGRSRDIPDSEWVDRPRGRLRVARTYAASPRAEKVRGPPSVRGLSPLEARRRLGSNARVSQIPTVRPREFVRMGFCAADSG